MRKTFVLDTNILLHSAKSLESFEDNIVALPIEVLEELDRFKSRNDELGRNAREVIRALDQMRGSGQLQEGIPLPNGGIVKIVMPEDSPGGPRWLEGGPDNKILMIAYQLAKKGNRVIFVSKDLNARIKANALGLEAEDFKKERVNFAELFTGYRELDLPTEAVERFYQTETYHLPGFSFNPNEFILLRDQTNSKHSALARAVDPENLVHLSQNSEKVWGLKPKTKEQRMALELLVEPNVKLVTLVGPAGTGKTLLALAAGLEATQGWEKYDRVLVSRPLIPFGKDIGFLPGDKEDKISAWMQPIFDNLYYLFQNRKSKQELRTDGIIRKEIEELRKNNLLELEALTYIRGRSISNQYMIVDEAQNLTPHEVKTIISRAGENTKVVLTGDPYQIDNPYLDSCSNGLIYVVERLKGEKSTGHILLEKSLRSDLASMAARLL